MRYIKENLTNYNIKYMQNLINESESLFKNLKNELIYDNNMKTIYNGNLSMRNKTVLLKQNMELCKDILKDSYIEYSNNLNII